MKKILVLIAAIIFTLVTQTTQAQQKPAADGKPMISKLPASPEQSSAPSLVPQKVNDEQSAKPIVPGGESKPMDTRLNLPEAKATTDALRKPIAPQPVSAPGTQPEKSKEIKKAKVDPASKQQ